jgi:hypothetical protein
MLFDAEVVVLTAVEFPARPIKVYEVPAARPVTVTGEDALVAVNPPGLEVA